MNPVRGIVSSVQYFELNDPISDVNQLSKWDVPYINLILIIQILGNTGANFI